MFAFVAAAFPWICWPVGVLSIRCNSSLWRNPCHPIDYAPWSSSHSADPRAGASSGSPSLCATTLENQGQWYQFRGHDRANARCVKNGAFQSTWPREPIRNGSDLQKMERFLFGAPNSSRNTAHIYIDGRFHTTAKGGKPKQTDVTLSTESKSSCPLDCHKESNVCGGSYDLVFFDLEEFESVFGSACKQFFYTCFSLPKLTLKC